MSTRGQDPVLIVLQGLTQKSEWKICFPLIPRLLLTMAVKGTFKISLNFCWD